MPPCFPPTIDCPRLPSKPWAPCSSRTACSRPPSSSPSSNMAGNTASTSARRSSSSSCSRRTGSTRSWPIRSRWSNLPRAARSSPRRPTARFLTFRPTTSPLRPKNPARSPLSTSRRASRPSRRPSSRPPRSTHPLDRTQRERDIRAELKEIAATAASPDLVAQIFNRAFETRATDIHFDPQEAHFRVRYRIDGQLHDVLRTGAGVRHLNGQPGSR